MGGELRVMQPTKRIVCLRRSWLHEWLAQGAR
jgi:hypothetical protein